MNSFMESQKSLVKDVFLFTCLLWAVRYVSGSPLPTGTVFVLTTVKVDAGIKSSISCTIGSLDEALAEVVVWSRGHPEKNYRMHKYDVITVELDWIKYSDSVFKYSSVVIRGTGRLTVSVVAVYKRSVTRYLSLPVSAWGSKYFITSCHWHSVLHVLSANNETEVRIQLPKVSQGHRYARQPSPETQEKSLYEADVVVIRLSEYQIFIIDMYAIQMVKNGMNSGMTIESTSPVAIVVSGSLQGTTVAPDWNTSSTSVPALASPTEISCSSRCTNMLWPTHILGEEFILTPLDGLMRVQFMLTSTEALTLVKVFGAKDQTPRIFKFTYIGENVLIDDGIYVTSTRPVNVFMLLRMTSDHQSEMTWSPVLPVSLFYHIYIWSTVEKGHLGQSDYVAVVVKYKDRSRLELDSNVFESWHWTSPHGPSQWTTGLSKIFGPGPHRVQGSGPGVRFGCYLIGLGRRVEYVQPVDMLGRAPAPAMVKPRTQERHRNVRSSDLSTQGIYAMWTPWTLSRCLNPCSLNASTVQSRNCIVSFKETKFACQLGVQENLHEERPCPNKPICPENCPSGSWYYNCTNTCGEKCIGDCDKYTGACSKCKSGYTHDYKHEHCQIECPQFTFGDACSGSCIKKCGSDCVDRTDGSCTIPPKDNSLIWLSIFISVTLVLLAIFCLQSSHTRKGSGDGSSEASNWRSQVPDVSGLLKSYRDDNLVNSTVFRHMSYTPSEQTSVASVDATSAKLKAAKGIKAENDY